MGLTDEETKDMQQVGELMSDCQMADVLEDLARRETALLDGPLGEGSMREVTLHNATVMAAASARLRSLGG